MINIYRRTTGGEGARMERWFNKHHISYQVLSPHDLNNRLFLKILHLSEQGFDSILISKNRGKKTWERLKHLSIEECSVDELIDLVLLHPQLIRTPIAFDSKHLLVGYSADELRIFIPSEFRKVERKVMNR